VEGRNRDPGWREEKQLQHSLRDLMTENTVVHVDAKLKEERPLALEWLRARSVAALCCWSSTSLIPKRIGITAQTARSMANWVLKAAEKVESHE
jgi:hypothetical protein